MGAAGARLDHLGGALTAGLPGLWPAGATGIAPDRRSAWRAACLEVLRLSGLFDPAFYGTEGLAHYHEAGWVHGRWPNPYFDPEWYRASHPDVAALNTDPLLHYVSYGEAEGRRPVAWFDPAWYRRHHGVPDGLHSLAHFLRHRAGGRVSPLPEFDAAWYCARYPDVAAAGIDPFEHYRVQGFREARDPSAAFDTRFYRGRYLRRQPDENPLLHYLVHRGEPGIHPRLPPGETTVAREVERFAAPGPLFEPVAPPAAGAAPRAMVLAYYLPQFHPIARNDAWWGEGFTEWRNVARGLPRFAGHYQPRIPRDLGHYSLDDPAVLPRQIALAQGAGLTGFVFHFYWFNGERLLEKPLERLLNDPSLDCPFCLMWANENWTRRWDGSDEDILIAQDYAPADEAALIACFARHFADARYIRLGGRPLLMIYRPGLIPDAAPTIGGWRARFRDAHGEDPILVMAQSFGDADPRCFGLDGAAEFPPHKLVAGLTRRVAGLDVLDDRFGAEVYDYDDLVRHACALAPPAFPLIRTAVPGWDNDARRQGQGMVVHGATPASYQRWLGELVRQAVAHPFFGTPVVCVNAWNEWAEGAYLEPDQHFGAAFLNATGRAILAAGTGARLLLVGHDAYPAGAQLLLLHIARQLRAGHGLRLEIVLGGGGALLPQYQLVAPTTVVEDAAALGAVVRRAGCTRAIVNSAAAAWCCLDLSAHGVATTLLVHEMPASLAAWGLLAPLRAAVAAGTSLVYPAEAVRAAVAPLLPGGVSRIMPQGVYQSLAAPPGDADRLRRAWGVADGAVLVVGLGHGDRRKGFDLFLGVWEAAGAQVHMAWVGSIDPALREALADRLARAGATGRFLLAGWRDDVAVVLAAADALLLTSREDPYPSAVLEALCAGVAVVAFAGSGGMPDLLTRTGAGTVVAAGDCAAMAAALPGRRASHVPNPAVVAAHDFPRYVRDLLRAAWPERLGVSVIVPCYRQAAMLPRRLHSIFGQTEGVDDIVLYDDASDDSGPAIAERLARQAGRVLEVVTAPANSGCPFAIWGSAVARAGGELVWIAEADDSAEPDFLQRMTQAMAPPDMLFAFCDSRAVDGTGAALPVEYGASYAAVGGAEALRGDAIFAAEAFAARFMAERNILFNVSAVLWRRAALAAALERLGGELTRWRVAGDWRLYIEVLTGATGRVAHVAEALNHHCRHAGSATARVSPTRHLHEIRLMQAITRRRLNRPGLAERQRRYLAEATACLGAEDQETTS